MMLAANTMGLRPLTVQTPRRVKDVRFGHSLVRCKATDQETDGTSTQKKSTDLKLYSTAVPVFALAGAEGIRQSLLPFAEAVNGLGAPDWLIKYGHPGNMAVVLTAMGFYGCGYLGWQIRNPSDGESRKKAKDLHPKLAIGMSIFFALGATGGLSSLILQGKPIFESSHVWTGILGLTLLALQGMLTLFFEDDPSARGLHAYFGTGILGLFAVHMALGIQLALAL